MGLDIEPWEPEESVGLIWHKWASGFDAPADFQDQAVALSEIAGRLAVLFRGLGGHPSVEIRGADDQVSTHRLGWRRRLGTVAEPVPQASFDGEILRLPQRLTALPAREANAALYIWLAACAAHGRPAPHHDDPLRADLARLAAARDAVARTLADAPGLVFTSENAVPFAGPGRGRPAICVGPHSAAVARAAGFDAITGPGDAIRLEPMLKDLPPGWLHPHGRHIARALPVEGVAVYDQQPVALNDRARAALAGGGPVMVPLFSPRSARLLSAQVQGARAALWVVPISAAAAGAWDGPAARMAVAPTPDAEGVLAGLVQVMAAQHS